MMPTAIVYPSLMDVGSSWKLIQIYIQTIYVTELLPFTVQLLSTEAHHLCV